MNNECLILGSYQCTSENSHILLPCENLMLIGCNCKWVLLDAEFSFRILNFPIIGSMRNKCFHSLPSLYCSVLALRTYLLSHIFFHKIYSSLCCLFFEKFLVLKWISFTGYDLMSATEVTLVLRPSFFNIM